MQFSGFVGYVRECVECLKELNVDGAADGALAELPMALQRVRGCWVVSSTSDGT